MSTTNYISSAIEWAQKKGFTQLKANHEDYESPSQFHKPDDETPFIPDITARKGDKKCYIEVATKTEDKGRMISKWKLLSTLAEMKGGKLFLLAPRGHKAFAERLLKKYNLQAQLRSL